MYSPNSKCIFQRGPDLRINNIQPSDAGVYMCLVSPTEADLTDIEDYDSGKRPIDTSFLEGLTIVLKVRSVPESVTRFGVRLSTILGVLMWEFPSNRSGGYPIRSFTAELRKYFDDADVVNVTTQLWHRLDPENIPSNVVRYCVLDELRFDCMQKQCSNVFQFVSI